MHVARTLLALAVVCSGLLLLLRLLRRPRILVVTYHRVTPDAELAQCAYPHRHVSTSSFAKQLRALRFLYKVVSLEELRAILAGARPLRRHVAVITFDDGYRDNFENAYPVLLRTKTPAAFFLSLGFVDRGWGFWFDRLADGVSTWDRRADLRRALRSLVPAPLVAALEAPLPQSERLRRAVSFLATLPLQERRAILKRLTPALVPAAEQTSARPLSWGEVREMHARGMAIGAHGVSHASLTRMPSGEARCELEESLTVVAKRLGAPVTALAYTHGQANEELARLARAAGAKLGFRLGRGENRPSTDPLLLVRRSLCEASSRGAFTRFSLPYFLCEITGVFDWLDRRDSSVSQNHLDPARSLDWTGPRDCARLPSQSRAPGRAASRVLQGLQAAALEASERR